MAGSGQPYRRLPDLSSPQTTPPPGEDLVVTEWQKAWAVLAERWRSLVCVALSIAVVLPLALLTDSAMGQDGWYAIWVLLVVLILAMGDTLGDTGLTFLLAILLLVLGGVVDLNVAIAGFGSDLVFAIGCLYVVSKGVRESTLLNLLVVYVLRKPKTIRSALVRLVPPVMIVSAFMNNTPIVAMLIPVVVQWSKACNLEARQLLLPLSFAAILGGMCTEIG